MKPKRRGERYYIKAETERGRMLRHLAAAQRHSDMMAQANSYLAAKSYHMAGLAQSQAAVPAMGYLERIGAQVFGRAS